MASVLVLHWSFDGQTRRIAQRVGEVLARAGHRVTVLDARQSSAARAIAGHEAVIIGGAVHFGRFARPLEKLVRGQAAALASGPNAFFSVCMTAAGPNAKPELAREFVDRFRRRVHWEPEEVEIFAGALPYSRYNPLLRLVMRFIVRMAGGDTDTSRDYEYTDWEAVDRFAARFASRLEGLALAA